jgi:hypothetical protein
LPEKFSPQPLKKIHHGFWCWNDIERGRRRCSLFEKAIFPMVKDDKKKSKLKFKNSLIVFMQKNREIFTTSLGSVLVCTCLIQSLLRANFHSISARSYRFNDLRKSSIDERKKRKKKINKRWNKIYIF